MQKIPKEIIIKMVCDKYKLSFDHIKMRIRRRELVIPRQIIMYLFLKYELCSETIASKLLDRKHPTALHAFNKISGYIETDKVFKQEIGEIERKISFHLPELSNEIIKMYMLGVDKEAFQLPTYS